MGAGPSGGGPLSMRFLFVTIQSFESAFYGAVGDAVARSGHDVAHVTYSRRASKPLLSEGRRAESLLDRMRELPTGAEPRQLADALAARYSLPSIREAYRGDPACDGKPEEACVGRAVAHFQALEQ